MDLRVLGVGGGGSPVTIFSGVNYAMENGADVISMSLSTTIDFPGNEVSEFRDAWEMGIPTVVSAGNNPNGLNDLANNPNVIVVGSINSENTISAFSSRGPQIDLVAPGEFIPASDLNGELVYVSGTSFSAPSVGSVIALMLSIRNDISITYLRKVIEHAALDLGDEGRDDIYGNGLLDAGNSVSNWKNFENIDFDNDGVLSGEEIQNGRDPFDPSDNPEVNDGFLIMNTSYTFASVVFILIIRFKMKKD